MQTITFQTEKKKQILNITSQIEKHLPQQSGLCHLFIQHTTAALTVADLDPGTDLDMLDAFEEMIPRLQYRHPHNPDHVGDHIMASLIGSDVSIPVEKGKLQLGTWQEVVLVELDGPRDRNVVLSFFPEKE